MQAARRVEEDQVVAELLRVGYARLGYLHRVALAHLEHGDAQLSADGLQPVSYTHLIGRQGRIVKEIRVLMKAVAQRKGKKVSVEIMD